MLLRDAINIPTAVRQGDLVFKLSDATEHINQTLDRYVVTDQLLEAFIDAGRLVRAAVEEHSSKAAFLAGSFGAGKSNFMGVFQLLLDGNPAALAKPELAPVVKELGDWRGDRRFLTVPFHLIGATSIESAVFGGYVAHLRKVHPEAPMPDVFADEPILDNADSLRATMGDPAFFAALGDDDGGGNGGWGNLGGWDAARYDTARSQPVGGADRRLLVQSLLDTLLSAYAAGAKANREGYVDIDTGLAALSRHADGLGYSGLILFLNELILWLMSRLADAAFVADEASKISKLVEASEASRPAPIVSFIARQRDLRDLIGSDVPGAERLAFVDQLNFQAGRFSTITLNDSNLPVVANKRLLQPVDDAGAAALAEAFGSLALTDDQRDALRGAGGTDADFALTYPFSPAFLTIVVDVAGALQRTRTGLRVLLDLLVRGRETLEVGHLVPVGDLYDVLAAADEPLSDAMKQPFESAKRIYQTSLRPMLLADHGLRPEDPVTAGFTNDDRLVKTLLLAALVPNSAPFKDLTARRLVALNHGLISSPVPGMETNVVVNKLNTWAARTGELQVGGDPHNPTVHLVLSDVDTRGILNSVGGVDNPGSRRMLIRLMVAEELGLSTDRLLHTTHHLWRGVPRTMELAFGNVRDASDLSDSDFAPSGADWKVVIDFPFDEEGHSPLDDHARVEQLRGDHEWRTICWIPAFFTAEMKGQLGDLVRLNHLLPIPGQTSDRFVDATKHLSAESRESARLQLEAQQRAARGRLQQGLKQAYGIALADAAVVDTSHGLTDHFPTLIGGFAVRPPVAATLHNALNGALEQGLEHCYPAAPNIEGEVKLADLRKVREICEEALEQADRRIPQVPAGAPRAVMNRIANPLRLGVQSEQAFLLDVSPHWDPLFVRKLGERDRGGATGHPTVADLRAWIDDPNAMGLSRHLQNLVIIVWAEATDRTFTDHGGPARVDIDSLADHYEVVAQDLPDPSTWAEARRRIEHLFGVGGVPEQPSAVGLAKVTGTLVQAVHDHAAGADALVNALGPLVSLTADPHPARLRTAQGVVDLLGAIGAADSDVARVHALVDAPLEPSPQAVGASLKSSETSTTTIAQIDLGILTAALMKPGGSELAKELTALLEADELATPLAPALRSLYERARPLVIGPPPGPGPVAATGVTTPGSSTPGTQPGAVPGRTLTSVMFEQGLDRDAAMARLEELRERLAAEEYADGRFDINISSTPGGDPQVDAS